MTDQADRLLLSIVIPAYNEEKRIGPTLDSVIKFLSAQSFTSEVIVADDGSSDRTAEVARSYASRFRSLRVISVTHRGKGGAVKSGMLAAAGKYRFLCDADLSMPIEQLPRFVDAMKGAAVVIGSREAKGAHRYDEPLLRHWMAHVFNLVTRTVLLLRFRDTQCGFKCFSREAAEKLFPLQRMEGFGFDAELLFLARMHGLAVSEIPIDWYHKGDSRVRPLRHTVAMLNETLSIWKNYWRGYYR